MKRFSYNEVSRHAQFQCLCNSLLPPLNFAGITRYYSETYCDYHEIESSYLALICDGNMDYEESSGKIHHCPPGTFVLLPRHSRYRWHVMKPVTAFQCAHGDFSFSEYGGLTFLLGNFNHSIATRNIGAAAARAFVQKITHLENHPFKSLKMTAAILELCATAMEEHPVSAQDQYKELNDRIMRSCIQYIEQNISVHYPISLLARRHNISLRKLFQLFQEYLQTPPQQYIAQCRMRLARQHLAAGLPVGEVAKLLGFSSGNYFVRFFRLHQGITPATFAKEVVTMHNP